MISFFYFFFSSKRSWLDPRLPHGSHGSTCGWRALVLISTDSNRSLPAEVDFTPPLCSSGVLIHYRSPIYNGSSHSHSHSQVQVHPPPISIRQPDGPPGAFDRAAPQTHETLRRLRPPSPWHLAPRVGLNLYPLTGKESILPTWIYRRVLFIYLFTHF